MEKAMKHTLHIQLRSCEGALLRAIGLMERRGYRVSTCSLGEAGGNGQEFEVVVNSERPADLLKRQLERLHDVLWVELKNPAARLAGHTGMRP